MLMRRRRRRRLVSTPDLITGRLTLTQLYQQLVTDHGLTLSSEAFHISWLTPYTTAMPRVANMLQELSDQYRLVLLSNVKSPTQNRVC